MSSVIYHVFKVHLHCTRICASFLLLNKIPGYGYITFIHSSVEERLSGFHLWTVMSNATVNSVQIFVRSYGFISLGVCVRVELLDHMVILCLVF